jgi:pilus retraction protein PilT
VGFQAQDLFLKSGEAPRVRVGAKVFSMDVETVRESHLQDILFSLLTESHKGQLKLERSVDFSFGVPEMDVRFRGNAFYQLGQLSVVFRVLWKGVPSFEELKLPPILKKVAFEKSGIILVAGMVSSGKSTTIAAMVDAINQNMQRHIITIEDPIEFLHVSKNSLVQQREIGSDAKDFNSALKYTTRQSPDVVVIGEMRDNDTMRFALNAAEVGRLVISTIHAHSVTQIFDRILGFVRREDERDTILRYFAANFTCLMVQKLLVAKDQKSLVPATEILIGNYTLRKLVMDKEFEKIHQALMNSGHEGMQTFDQSLLELFKKGSITKETAIQNARRPVEMEKQMQGIVFTSASGGKILGS